MRNIFKLFLVFIFVALPVSIFQGKEVDASNYKLSDWSTWQPLSQGSTGGFVKALQANLWATGYQTATGSIDGSFGPSTKNAVKYFQNLEGITADGMSGPQTWRTFEKYASSGLYSRTYNHWQSSYYTVYYSTYDHGSWDYTEGILDGKDKPNITVFTLWTNGL